MSCYKFTEPFQKIKRLQQYQMKELFLSKPLLQGRHFKIKIIAIKDTLVKSENTNKRTKPPGLGHFPK